MYSPLDQGKDISFDYFAAKSRYGKGSSPISKKNFIFEVDERKKDGELEKYKKLRDDYYTRHFLLATVFSLFLLICSAAVLFFAKGSGWLLITLPAAVFLFEASRLVTMQIDRHLHAGKKPK